MILTTLSWRQCCFCPSGILMTFRPASQRWTTSRIPFPVSVKQLLQCKLVSRFTVFYNTLFSLTRTWLLLRCSTCYLIGDEMLILCTEAKNNLICSNSIRSKRQSSKLSKLSNSSPYCTCIPKAKKTLYLSSKFNVGRSPTLRSSVHNIAPPS